MPAPAILLVLACFQHGPDPHESVKWVMPIYEEHGETCEMALATAHPHRCEDGSVPYPWCGHVDELADAMVDGYVMHTFVGEGFDDVEHDTP